MAPWIWMWFQAGSEEVLGLMPYFRVLTVPATPHHNEVTITSVRDAFSNSSTASQRLCSQRSFVLGEGGTQKNKKKNLKKFFLSYLFLSFHPTNENHMQIIMVDNGR